MSFITDKQTQTDLNLLGKYKTGSVFNLFNRVKTRGGELLLEEMFRMPLSDAKGINIRAAMIRYTADIGIKLDVNSEFMEMTEQYLAEGRPFGRLQSIYNCYREKIQGLLFRSPKLNNQQRYIHAVWEVLLSASGLLGHLEKSESGNNPLGKMQAKLSGIIHLPALRYQNSARTFTVMQTARFQYIFRNAYRQELGQLLQLLYEMDVFISVAEVAKEMGLVFAEADNKGESNLIDAKNLRHPSLPTAIGNTISLGTKQNMLFLTGANMAGKSTWMKTIGISFYLAHMGFPVAADSMKFKVMDGIFTSINVPDDINMGWSHFYAEVMRVKMVAKELSSGKKLLVLFDELFKGTNVKDAFDATLVVTGKLAQYRCCAFVISTHIIEVAEGLAGIPNIQFSYMPTVMNGPTPQYTYILTPGITQDRQGMILIENEKILELLA